MPRFLDRPLRPSAWARRRSRTKRIFFANAMDATPFMAGSRREKLRLPSDVAIVDSADDADVIVSRFLDDVAPYFHLDRQYYLWTHEPSWCIVGGKHFLDRATGRTVQVSTAWNGDIYMSPLYYFPDHGVDREEALRKARDKTSSCVVLATYRRKFDRYFEGKNVDLTEFRQRIAIELQRVYDSCDIYGRAWPDDVVLSGESRGRGWSSSKQTILEPYAFNLALENTNLKYYVTEKLWDAYISGSVPIYFAEGTGVHEVLSEGTFVDCSHMSSAAELYDSISSISTQQRLEMVSTALDDIQKISASETQQGAFQASVDRFVQRIRDM